MTHQDDALRKLLEALAARGYAFVTPTPATHRRVLKRVRAPGPATLRDVFGLSLPFDAGDLPGEIVEAMQAGGVLGRRGRRLASRVRASNLGGSLLLHSAYPTTQKDAVFFGPDSYRFADFIAGELGAESSPVESAVDIGAGAGVGGLTAARLHPSAQLLMTDVNPTALRYARVNAAFQGATADYVLSDGLEGVDGPFDLVLANPPYIAGKTGAEGRTYRDGGEMLGARLSLDWAEAGMERLRPRGRMLLYTGSAIVGGEDRLKTALTAAAEARGCELRYREIDPDVFGEELSRPEYAPADRIAVVGAVLVKTA